jgi:hypothetical protein
MKLGAENRNTVIIAAVLGVVALFMMWRTFFSGSGPVIASNSPAPQVNTPSKAGPPARRIGRRPVRTAAPAGQATVTASLDPRLRLDLLKGTEQTEYKGGGRNIFDKQSEIEIPKPLGTGLAKTETPPTPQPQSNPGLPPPPPPINLKFFGLLNRPGQPRQAFLLQNDEVFVAKEGEVVNRRYKVVKINNNSVEIEDLLGNNKQTIPLTAG